MDTTLIGIEITGRYVWNRPVEVAAISANTTKVRFDFFCWTPRHAELSPEACTRLLRAIREDLNAESPAAYFVHGPQALSTPGRVRAAQTELGNVVGIDVGASLSRPDTQRGGIENEPIWDLKRTSVALTWGEPQDFRPRRCDDSHDANVFEVQPRDASWEHLGCLLNHNGPSGSERQKQSYLEKAFDDVGFQFPSRNDIELTRRQLSAALSLYIGLLYWLYKDEDDGYCGFFGSRLTRPCGVWREGYVLDLALA